MFAATGSDEDDKFCCDAQQVENMSKQFNQISMLLGSCPSCVKNLRNVFCFMTCDPHQSKYLSPIMTKKVAKDPTAEVVTEMKYYIKEQFARNMYDSCSGMKFLVVMCGAGEHCNANR